MRRLIKSLLGKAVGQLVVMALLLFTFSLFIRGRAEAQLTTQPTWAVLPFVVDSHAAGVANVGNTASDAVASELSKTNLYDVVPQEQIKRAAENLGLTLPVMDPTTYLRLAQEVRASTVVTGEVVGYRILPNGGGKQAIVGVNVNVIDVASGLPINGAGVTSKSTVRVGDVSDETLVNEALGAAAAEAISTIRSQTLPTGTILNTTEETALINQGTRTGFTKGQHVVVVRGRQEVATGTIVDVEPDQAYLHPDRVILGIQPGDKARVIFDYKRILSIDAKGNTEVARAATKHSNAGFVQILLLVALGAVLFGGGHSNSGQGASQLIAEAEMYPDATGDPSVSLHWGTDIFHRANANNVQWQIWRSDVPDSPVLVVSGTQLRAHDVSTQAHTGSYSTLAAFNGQTGGTSCAITGLPNDGTITAAGPAPGHAYQYRIELVYKLSSL
ncbi:MAG TPA: hypothetical protein VHE55_12055, partial [Fimbriimonadaceae bacterium]|nr:hypothetical protein [Fimbriimonadaceae bacterium]